MNRKRNPHSRWYSGAGVDSDAAARIYESCARVRADYDGPRFTKHSRVFTIGSCFAREIENALRRLGGNILSVEPSVLDHPYFGAFREGFFHRFTPPAILQEFRSAFDDLPGWDRRSSLIIETPQGFDDLNYWSAPDADHSRVAVDFRRKIGQDLVRRAAEADVIVVTLGYIESWKQISTGFHVNWFSPALARLADQYEFSVLSYQEVLDALEDMLATLERHHTNGQFILVVTVSPVPLGVTFTRDDIVTANSLSKSTLRAAAGTFCARHDKVHYFPSYEIATHSDPRVAWQEDRIHVLPGLVDHIVTTFLRAYFEESAFNGEIVPETPRNSRAYSWQR